jgi:glycosyltransferase involved in cell wall biosynthesis
MLNTHDCEGGATRAALRLCQGLQRVGVDCTFLVQNKKSLDSPTVGPSGRISRIRAKLLPHLDHLPLRLYPERKPVPWSVQYFPCALETRLSRIPADIVHLHWIGAGFVSIPAVFRLKKPLLWTLHDMWPFTGGCYYDQGCGRYKQACGACPLLGSKHRNDLSHWVWRMKKRSWQAVNLTLVSPSRWLAREAQSSSLFQGVRMEVIPYGLDLSLYKPVDKVFARKVLNLPPDRRLVLFGAANAVGDPRKGGSLLRLALKELSSQSNIKDVELVVFGASRGPKETDFVLPTHYLGQFQDEVSLSLVYSAADVFVAPSIQDNLPNTVMESMACGTPCVAFDIGGMSDLIEHERTGFLAKPLDPSDLASGLIWVLSKQGKQLPLGREARAKVEREFDIVSIASKYEKLYEDMLANSKSHTH